VEPGCRWRVGRRVAVISVPMAKSPARPGAAPQSTKTTPARTPSAKPPVATTSAKTRPAPTSAATKRGVAGRPARDEVVGFGPETFAFLTALEQHNERAWFEANRERYERFVRGPALAWISAFGPALQKLAPHFVADPRPSGGSLLRIHRDTRFAADKRPYKSHIGMHFRHAGGKDIHAPGLYVHIEPGRSMLGVGLWHPEPEPLAKIRAHLIEHPQRGVP
jgi:Conserved hypothetical protein (DUF2461)